MGDPGDPDRRRGVLLLILALAWGSPASELHVEAREASDPTVALQLLREAAQTSVLPDEKARIHLDLARLLGPTPESEQLLSEVQVTLPIEALEVRAEQAWSHDDRDGALRLWTEALTLRRGQGPQPEAEHRLVWRHLVDQPPTDPHALDAALEVLGIERIALQRALRPNEEVLIWGVEQAPDWVIQVGPSQMRWAAVPQRTPDLVFAKLAESPRLLRRLWVGPNVPIDWRGPAPEPHPTVASALTALGNRPSPPAPSRLGWLLGLLGISGVMGGVGWFWVRR